MKTSTDRIVTTHVGSLPRPAELTPLLLAEHAGEPVDRARLTAAIDAAVVEMVRRQFECGIDILNDGEMSKVAYTFYVKRSLTGIAPSPPGSGAGPAGADLKDHPDFAEMQRRNRGGLGPFAVVVNRHLPLVAAAAIPRRLGSGSGCL